MKVFSCYGKQVDHPSSQMGLGYRSLFIADIQGGAPWPLLPVCWFLVDYVVVYKVFVSTSVQEQNPSVDCCDLAVEEIFLTFLLLYEEEEVCMKFTVLK